METAIKQFEPSCGSEAMQIYDLCETCERDRAAWSKDRGGEERLEDGCPILCQFGMHGRHPEIKWHNGGIKCMKYVEEGKEIPEEDTETLPLFD